MLENNGHAEPAAPPFDEDMCVSYLLGELSDADQERFETAYFNDDAFFDRFMAVKDELLDLFARGELDAERQEQVRSHFFATAPRRKQLARADLFIKAVNGLSNVSAYDKLIPAVDGRRSEFSGFRRLHMFAWAGAAVLFIAGLGVWWLSTQQGLERTPDTAEVQPVRSADTSGEVSNAEPDAHPTVPKEKEDLSAEIAAPNKSNSYSGSPGALIARTHDDPVANKPKARLLLTAISTRDINSANTLNIFSDTASVSLELVPPSSSYKRFTATIGSVDGRHRWRTPIQRISAGRLIFDLDPAALKGADYLLTLAGVRGRSKEIVAEYYFHVVHNGQKTPPQLSPK